MSILPIDFLQHCSFFLISSNLTFGKSEINYVSFPNERRKKLVYDFKVSLAHLWHGTLQRERKITLHTWSIKKKKPLKWIAGWDPVWHKSWHWWHSPWAQGYLAWTRRLLGPYQWALAHPLGAPKPCRLKKNWWGWQHIWACYGFYFSQKQPRCYRLQSPAQQHQRDDWASRGKQTLLQINFKTETFLLFHLHCLFSFTPYIHPRCSNLIANRHFHLPYCVLGWQFVPANWKFCVGLPRTKHQPITNDTDMISVDSAGLHCFSRQDRKLTAATVFSNS